MGDSIVFEILLVYLAVGLLQSRAGGHWEKGQLVGLIVCLLWLPLLMKLAIFYKPAGNGR